LNDMRWRKQYATKRLEIAGLCLVSMLAMSMALAGNASAEALWLACSEGSAGHTKYSSDQCSKAEAGGKWEFAPIPSGVGDTVRLSVLTLTLTDLSAGPLKEKATIRCTHPTAGWGLISAPNTIVVTKVKIEKPSTECERVSGPCKAGGIEKAEAVDLPWKGATVSRGETIATSVESDGNGEPGWAVTCNTSLGSKTDTCITEEGENEYLSEENVESGGTSLVLGTFLNTEKAKCSEGGKETGKVEGQIAVSPVPGWSLIGWNVGMIELEGGPTWSIPEGTETRFTVKNLGFPAENLAVVIGPSKGFQLNKLTDKCSAITLKNNEKCTVTIGCSPGDAGHIASIEVTTSSEGVVAGRGKLRCIT
jgi:hypothetical protein